jgi:hypothetical protein
MLALSACRMEENGSGHEGLQLLQASEQDGVSARYLAGTTRLDLRSSELGQQVVAEVTDGDGRLLTRIQLPSDLGIASSDVRVRMEFGVADSLQGLRDVAQDPQRAAELMWAYYGAMEALKVQLPAGIGAPLRDALFMQPSVLSAALSHLDPSVLQDNPNLPPRSDSSNEGYDDFESSASNDDYDDYYSAPVYEQIYTDTSTGEYKVALYGSGCRGACGPGCGWCAGGYGIYVCYTNSFCQWHDDHCGSYWHFFDCR